MSQPNPTSHYWQWRGHTVHYVQGHPEPQPGQDAPLDRQSTPPLLLVHGFGASTDHWKKNILVLARQHQVWAIDLLGFGRSAKPNQIYNGDLWRDQLADFIREHIQAPTVLVGNSLGGYASLCTAAQVPDVAAGVILLNSAGPFTPREPVPEPSPLAKAWKNLTRSLLTNSIIPRLIFWNLRRKATVRKTLTKVYLNPEAVTDELVDDILRPAFDPGAFEVFASVFRSPQGAKVDELLNQLTHPLLLLWGEADPWMQARSRSQLFREHYPTCQEHFLQAGHCPHDEVPDQVNPLISQWVQTLKPPALLKT